MNHPLTPVPERPDRIDWREEASCREYNVTRGDDPWFSDEPHERELAVAICGECPVRDRCATTATGEVHGVWAGTPRRRPVGRPPKPGTRGRCGDCGRATRPKHVRAAAMPKTVAEAQVGQCLRCWRKERNL